MIKHTPATDGRRQHVNIKQPGRRKRTRSPPPPRRSPAASWNATFSGTSSWSESRSLRGHDLSPVGRWRLVWTSVSCSAHLCVSCDLCGLGTSHNAFHLSQQPGCSSKYGHELQKGTSPCLLLRNDLSVPRWPP